MAEVDLGGLAQGDFIDGYDEAIAALDLSGKVTSKLAPSQVEHMKERIVEANLAFDTAGSAIRACAQALFDIKVDVKPGNWKALLESGALAMPARAAQDLVNAHVKWLSGSDIPDYCIGGFSSRTLNAIANCKEAEVRAKLEKQLIKGNLKTEAAVRAFIRGGGKPSASKKPAKPTSLEQWIGELTIDQQSKVYVLSNKAAKAAELELEKKALNKQIKELKAKNEQLERLLAIASPQ